MTILLQKQARVSKKFDEAVQKQFLQIGKKVCPKASIYDVKSSFQGHKLTFQNFLWKIQNDVHKQS